EQLRKVQEFRSRIGNEAGVLYCDFATSEEFIRLSRDHLIQLIAQQWAGDTWTSVPGLIPASAAVPALILGQPEPDEDGDDEPFLLDLRVRQDDAFETAMSTVRQIGERMVAWGDADREW